MATITKPMALDETLHTTESTPRRQADVLAGIQQAIREGFGQVASGIEYDNTTSGLTSDNVQGAIDEVDAALDVVEDDIASTQEVTGDPITLTDAAPINAEKLEVVMEPKQNLHGQSYPYVGGAGKNKLPLTVDGLKSANTDGTWSGNVYTRNNATFTILTDNDGNVTGIKKSGTTNANTNFYIIAITDLNSVLSEGPYKVNGCPTRQSGDGFELRCGLSGTDTGSGITVTAPFSGLRFYIYIPSGDANTIEFKPMVMLATETSTTFAPYSNICPISGYDSVSVDGTGVNAWDEEWENGYFYVNASGNLIYSTNETTVRSKNYIPVEPNTTYYGFNDASSAGNQYIYRVAGFDENQNYLRLETSSSTNRTITTGEGTKYIKFFVEGLSSYTTGISINFPSTDTQYHAYQSTTASITFGQTVYGGKSDFVMGGTKKTLGFKTFDGTENWDDSNSNGFKITVADSGMTDAKDHAKCISNLYQYGSSVWTAGCFGIASVTRTLWVENATSQRFANLAAFKAYLAEHPLQVCYELATPTTIFTLPTDLKLLENINNISTDGTTINLGYQQNNVVGELKGEIEQAFNNHAMIYNIQSESTAVNMEYTDDYKAVVCEVPFVQEQHDYSTTPPTHWNIDLSACDITVNGFACFYADSGGIFIENYKVMPTIESVRKDDGCFKVGIGFYNVKMTAAADNIDNFIISMDITAFGKVLDLRTLRN